MKVNPFWAILVAILLVWTGNYLYAAKYKLEHPIFLNHYLDVDLSNEQYIPFYFITNKEDTSFIQTVELGNIRGIPDQFIGNNGVEEIEQIGRYSLKRVNIQFRPETFVKPEEAMKFNEITVYFSENRTTTYPIGQIAFPIENEELNPLSFKSGSADEYTETRMVVTEAVAIESVSTALDDALHDRFHIKLQSTANTEIAQPEPVIENDEWNKAEGIDVRNARFPLRLNENDWLTVKSFADPSLHAVMDVKINLRGTSDTGKPFTGQVGHLQYEPPYLTKESIQQIIDERMEATRHE